MDPNPKFKEKRELSKNIELPHDVGGQEKLCKGGPRATRTSYKKKEEYRNSVTGNGHVMMPKNVKSSP